MLLAFERQAQESLLPTSNTPDDDITPCGRMGGESFPGVIGTSVTSARSDPFPGPCAATAAEVEPTSTGLFTGTETFHPKLEPPNKPKS